MRSALWATVFFLLVLGAHAASLVTLIPSRPVARGIAALPRLAAHQDDKAAARINRALAAVDEIARNDVPDCKQWKRTITVRMRGPLYLSLLIHDDRFCGAYPDAQLVSLVFDLRTGTPVEWKHVFPAEIVEKERTMLEGGEAYEVDVTSPMLWRLYTQLLSSSGHDDCGFALSDMEQWTRLMLWPDAAANGIGMQAADLPHVASVCRVPATIPIGRLHDLGVSGEFIDALDEAHRRGWYDKAK
jgi:hypothetical protein